MYSSFRILTTTVQMSWKTYWRHDAHKDSGEIDFLPAFPGTGMILVFLTAQFGINRGRPVKVPVHLRSVTLINFQISREGRCTSLGWMYRPSKGMVLLLETPDPFLGLLDGDEQIHPKYANLSAYTWTEHMHEVNPRAYIAFSTEKFKYLV